MAFYNDDLIQQLKAHADIALIIERFVPLKKSGVGRYYVAFRLDQDGAIREHERGHAP